jgi:hypothetical protein
MEKIASKRSLVGPVPPVRTHVTAGSQRQEVTAGVSRGCGGEHHEGGLLDGLSSISPLHREGVGRPHAASDVSVQESDFLQRATNRLLF